MIEHTPDLIQFLNDCDEILNENGVVSLAIPDKRYCFDHFRPSTGLAQIIDSHLQKNTLHTPGTVAEYFLNVVSKNGTIAWDSSVNGDYQFAHCLADARNCMNSVIEDKTFIDVHAWCFTPHSFRLLIHDLFALGFIPFKEISFHPTVGCEFFMTLGREGNNNQLSRMAMLNRIEAELRC